MLLKDKRIFIVEDDASNRLIVQMLLQQHGAKVIFERLRSNTIRRLRESLPIDIILLDLMLPEGSSGYDIFDEIRRIEEFNAIPIVAVSAADASTEVPKAQDKGFSGYIGKPVDFQNFPKQLVTIMNGEKIWQLG